MSLHNDIMNIPANSDVENYPDNLRLAYKVGHRDARHAAAEMALKADSKIEKFAESLHRMTCSFEHISALASIYGDTLPTGEVIIVLLASIQDTKKILKSVDTENQID